MFVQQVVTPTPSASPEQKKIMYFVPVMMTVMFIIFPFPSGLTLYWLVSNIITVIQSTVIRSEKDISPTLATIIGGVIVFTIAYSLTLI